MDAEFSFLTAEQGDRLRTGTSAALARRGVRTVIHAPYLQSETHGTFPLKSLAQKCHHTAEDSWPELIDQHVANLLSASEQTEMSRDEILERACLRLLPADFSPHPDHFRYAKPIADGLVEVVAVDLPDAVRLLDDPDVEQIGIGVLRSAARARLVNEAIDDYQVTHRPDGTAIHLVNGESMFVASKALVLPQLFKQVVGSEPPADGVLVAVPWRHHLAFHPIVDGTVLTALNDLTAYAIGAYGDNPGQLSPRLYWWKDGKLISTTTIDDETKTIEATPPAELVNVMRRLRND